MATRNTEPQNRGVARPPLCPYVARFDARQTQNAPVDYPSFENHCLAVDGEVSLPLADQATFCLSGSYQLCERFLAVHLEDGPAPVPPAYNEGVPPVIPGTARQAEAQWPQPQPLFEETMAGWLPQPNRTIWTWVSAAVIFGAVLLAGGGVAAYLGWQLVLQSQLLVRGSQNNPINTLANGATPLQTPAFLVITATSAVPPAAENTPPAAPIAVQPNETAQNFPVAVTPTPIVVGAPSGDNSAPVATNAQETNAVAPTETPVPPRNILLPTTEGEATPAAVINVLQEVPTRRPTPVFEIPTSTPVALEAATQMPTATPTLAILGTPVVVFAPDQVAVPPGECTKVRWHVVNVREVYYENQPAFGDGTHEECIDKEADTYALTVIFGDGQTKIYTTTVTVLWPTATPTLTPSFTPEPPATPTWTPEPPTLTPTPNVIYAVALSLNGSSRQGCTAGTTCEVGVLVTNMGDHPDTLSVEFLQRGSDNVWLCRQDGVCAEQKLTISSVGPGNTAFLVLRATLAAESAGNVFTYVLRGVSDGSQGTMTSGAVTVEIESQAP